MHAELGIKKMNSFDLHIQECERDAVAEDAAIYKNALMAYGAAFLFALIIWVK